jgi:hypothetical protein
MGGMAHKRSTFTWSNVKFSEHGNPENGKSGRKQGS